MNKKPIKDKRFYVYSLSDPRDGKVFYVGKGCKNRANSHQINAVKFCHNDNVYKAEKIRNIVNSGNDVVVEIITCGMSNKEAFEKEREIINRIGIDNLTNISPGVFCAEERIIILMKEIYVLGLKMIRLGLMNDGGLERVHWDIHNGVKSELLRLGQVLPEEPTSLFYNGSK